MNAIDKTLLEYWTGRYAEHIEESRVTTHAPAFNQAKGFMGVAIFKRLWEPTYPAAQGPSAKEE